MKNYYILTSDGELYHYGVKGMKWGVIRKTIRDRAERKKRNRMRSIMIRSANDVNREKVGALAKTAGRPISVTGYDKRSKQVVNHIVNERGKVILSSINNRAIASGKAYIDSLNLKDYYRNPSLLNIEYDVYD